MNLNFSEIEFNEKYYFKRLLYSDNLNSDIVITNDDSFPSINISASSTYTNDNNAYEVCEYIFSDNNEKYTSLNGVDFKDEYNYSVLRNNILNICTAAYKKCTNSTIIDDNIKEKIINIAGDADITRDKFFSSYIDFTAKVKTDTDSYTNNILYIAACPYFYIKCCHDKLQIPNNSYTVENSLNYAILAAYYYCISSLYAGFNNLQNLNEQQTGIKTAIANHIEEIYSEIYNRDVQYYRKLTSMGNEVLQHDSIMENIANINMRILNLRSKMERFQIILDDEMKNMKGRKILLWFNIVVLLLFIICAVVLYFILNDNYVNWFQSATLFCMLGYLIACIVFLAKLTA